MSSNLVKCPWCRRRLHLTVDGVLPEHPTEHFANYGKCYGSSRAPEQEHQDIQVGCRVMFTGPIYRYAGGPQVAQQGTVEERSGHWAQEQGKEPKEMIVVRFDGDKVATCLDIDRIQLIK